MAAERLARARVLQVTAIPMTALRFVVPLAAALRDAGCEVELATGPGRGLEALEASGFPVDRIPISRGVFDWRNLHALGALRALVRARSVDIVHTHTPAAGAVGRLAVWGLGTRSVYTLHGSLWGAGVPGWRRGLFTVLERRLARSTDRLFTVNPDDAEDCVRGMGVPADRVIVLPAGGAGVAPEFFEVGRAPAVRRRVRERLGLTAGQKVVGYVGRTVEAKGLGILGRSFSEVAREDPSCRLVIVGGALEGDRGAYDEERFRRRLDRDAAGRVLWLGFRDRVAPLMSAMDVIVLPSRREGFGMSLAEAGAVGRPVVATDTRGARAAVEHERSGLLVPVDDAGALARALLRLVSDGALAARMGEAGRRRAAERFTRESVLAAYLSGYRTLLDAPSDRAGVTTT